MVFNAFPDYNDVDSWEGSIKSLGRACCLGDMFSGSAAVGGRCAGGARAQRSQWAQPLGTPHCPGCMPCCCDGSAGRGAAQSSLARRVRRLHTWPGSWAGCRLHQVAGFCCSPPRAASSLCRTRWQSRSTCCSAASTWIPRVGLHYRMRGGEALEGDACEGGIQAPHRATRRPAQPEEPTSLPQPSCCTAAVCPP